MNVDNKMLIKPRQIRTRALSELCHSHMLTKKTADLECSKQRLALSVYRDCVV